MSGQKGITSESWYGQSQTDQGHGHDVHPCLHPAAKKRAAHPDAQKVWHWISAAIRELPNRSTPIIFADANAHVGTVRDKDQMVDVEEAVSTQGRRVSMDDYDEYPCIGPYNMEVGKANGTMMRQFMEGQHMCAINTWFPQTEYDRKTWFGHGGQTGQAAHRVDYIIMPLAAVGATRAC